MRKKHVTRLTVACVIACAPFLVIGFGTIGPVGLAIGQQNTPACNCQIPSPTTQACDANPVTCENGYINAPSACTNGGTGQYQVKQFSGGCTINNQENYCSTQSSPCEATFYCTWINSSNSCQKGNPVLDGNNQQVWVMRNAPTASSCTAAGCGSGGGTGGGPAPRGN